MSLRRALSLSYVEKYGSYVIALASTIVLSRLLGPADIGAFAVGMAVVGIVAVIRELGLSTYIVQERELTEERIRATFTLAICVGVGLGAIVLALAIPAGRFYDDPRVTTIVWILAGSFLLTPFGSISQALMSRELRFGTLTWIRLTYALVSAGVSIALALLGHGPASLAWGTVAAGLVNAVLSMRARPHTLKLSFKREELRRVLAVGGPATAIAMVDDLTSSLPELVLGRAQNLSEAGLFSRARGLSQMAHQLIARAAGQVFVAAFAALSRDGLSAAPLYTKATECITLLGWCFLGSLAVLASPAVTVLFGEQWISILPLLRWLCVGAGLLLLTSGAQHLLIGNGGTRDVLDAKLLALPAQIVCLALGAWLGAEAMAMATVLSSAVLSGLLCNAVRKRIGISFERQLTSFRNSLPIAAVCAAGSALHLLVPAATPFRPMVELVVGGLGGTLGALVALHFSSHPLKDELRRAVSAVRARRAN